MLTTENDSKPMAGGGPGGLGRTQSLKQQKLSNVCCSFFCEEISYVIFAVLFGIYYSEPKYHAGNLCGVQMLDWSKAAFIYETVKAANAALTILLVIVLILKKTESLPMSMFMYIYGFRALSFFAAIVIWIGLIVSYKNHIHCDRLGELVLTYIILVGIGVGMLACCGCLLICGGLGLGLAGMAANKNKE